MFFYLSLQNNLHKMKTKIINKAIDMFLKIGFKTLTVDDIASEMGISKRTIYEHFHKKHDLVEAATIHLYEKISNGIDEIFAMNKNPIEELFVIKDFVMENLKNESSSPFYQLQKYYPQIYGSLMSRQFIKMNECVLENLKKGIEQRLYRDDINLRLISRFYFAGINSIKDAELFNPIQFNTREVQQTYLEYHLRAICTQKGIDFMETIIKHIVNKNE
tara:strand:+ start:1823 stop:2476 length:654 start_codon:yes stop_codon:yes gene_type:complete